ncbi:MAG: MFS transporter [Halobacteriales archaeon]
MRRYWTDPRRRRWLGWGALATVFLLVSVYRLSTAVLAERLMAAFSTTGAELGTLHAAFFYIYAVLQLPAGALADRAGTRWTATGGALMMNIGAIAFAFSDSYPTAFFARTLIGLGASVLYITILRFGANWFRPREFATLNGLTIAIAGVGGILATTPLAITVGLFGWRSTMVGLGVIGLATTGAVVILVRDTPAAAGLEPIEGVPTADSLSLREVATNARAVIGEPETWLIAVLSFCSVGINITLLGLWGVPYVVQLYDVSVTRASTYTLMGSLGLVIGSPAIGWLSDHLGSRTPLMIVGGVIYTAAFLVIAITVTPPLPVVGVVFFLTSFLSGAFVLGYTVIKERHSTAASGVSTGTVNTAAYTGAALFPTAMGIALDAFWTGETVAGARVYTVFGYRVAFAIATAAGVIALLCAVLVHRRTDQASG